MRGVRYLGIKDMEEKMIKLSNETKIVKADSKLHKKGDILDNSVYLIGLDTNNLALQRGNTILNYFGDVQVALKRALNYIIKGSDEELTLLRIEKQIKELHKAIEEIENDRQSDQTNREVAS